MKPNQVGHYILAVLSVAAAVALKLAFFSVIGSETPFLLLFLAILISAWVGGAGPGVLATILSATAAAYYFVSPPFSLRIGRNGAIQLAIFIAESALVLALTTARKRSETAKESALQTAELALQRQRELDAQIMLVVEASGALLRTPDPAEVARNIPEIAAKSIAADGYAVWRKSESSNTWRVVSSKGLPDGDHTLDAPNAWTPDSRVISIEDVNESPMLETRREVYRAWGIRSLLLTPLWIRGQSSGSITFYYKTPHRSSDAEMRIAEMLGNLASSAIAMAELYENQRELRAQAEEREKQLVFLAEASTELASSLDYETTLARVARLAVPHFADWCGVDILAEDGAIRLVALAHADPAKVELARRFRERYPPDPEGAHGVLYVVRTGNEDIVNDIPDSAFAAAARDAEQLQMVREIGISSFASLPLIARGRVLGAITFVKSQPGSIFGQAELDLARELARRAAIAMDNAALFREAQHKRADAESAAELLRQSNEDLERFAYAASHDLQEPLRTIASYVQLLQLRYQHRLDSEADEFIDFVIGAVQRMVRLLQDLLEYSRIGHENEPPRPVRTDAVLRDVIGNLQAAIEETGATVVHDPLPTLTTDPGRLGQVFQNLISNALKFRNAVPPQVHISAEQRNGEWVFAVRDNGLGFNPEYAHKLFIIFQRLHGREYSGTGVGLAICKRIIERHGGRIWAESKMGEGSTFYFSLPAR